MAALIAAQRAGHGIPAAVACRALGVSRSWFHGVAAWIEEYNTTRRHSACGMTPPVAWKLAAGREAA